MREEGRKKFDVFKEAWIARMAGVESQARSHLAWRPWLLNAVSFLDFLCVSHNIKHNFPKIILGGIKM